MLMDFIGIYYLSVTTISIRIKIMQPNSNQLLKVWNAGVSSLSCRSRFSRRVSILRSPGLVEPTVFSFEIAIDSLHTFHASEVYNQMEPPCAWLLLKVTPEQYRGVWLYQLSGTDIPLESVAYALSTWYHDSYKTTGQRTVVVYFTNTLEIKNNERWDTLYAKHPILRDCHGSITFSRSKKTNIDWSNSTVLELLTVLYHTVRKEPGNKVPFQPIRMKN